MQRYNSITMLNKAFFGLAFSGLIILLASCQKPEIYDPYADWDYHEDFVYRAHTPASPEACKILIIGNSLTYFNDQPDILKRIAVENHRKAFVDDITFPGVQMRQHCTDEYTLRKIHEQQWDYVILQEAVGEVIWPEDHPTILPFIETLKAEILGNNPATKIIYFMPWALKDDSSIGFMTISFDDYQKMITAGTVQFGITADLEIAPVGEAWRIAYADSSGINLFYTDGAHPSWYGSFLGASVYFAAIFQDSMPDDSYISWQCKYLKDQAYGLVMDDLEKWHIPVLEDREKWTKPDDELPIPTNGQDGTVD